MEKVQASGNFVFVDCLVYVEQEKLKQNITGFASLVVTNLKCDGLQNENMDSFNGFL